MQAQGEAKAMGPDFGPRFCLFAFFPLSCRLQLRLSLIGWDLGEVARW